MPSFNTAGKSKEDLALVAQLANLLTPDQTAAMTRTQLVKFLEKLNSQGETDPEKPTRGRKPGTVAKEAAAKPEAADKPAKAKGRPARTKANAAEEIPPPLDELQIEILDASPEAAEAAAENEKVAVNPTTLGVTPEKKTSKPVRRIRIIGTPDEQPEATQNRITRGSQSGGRLQAKPGRPGRGSALSGMSRYAKPDESLTGSEAALYAKHDYSEYPNGDAPLETDVLPGDSDQDTETAAGQRPVIEAGEEQSGILEIMPDGYGFLRLENYLQGARDIYVPPQYIRRFGLRQGDHVVGPVKLQRENDRFQALLYIKEVNGMAPEKMLHRPQFDKLTPIYPDERFVLETVRNELSTRIIDLVAPIGKGQRGMIVSPPKAGKTILLQKIANAISVNNPTVKLIVLLIDERPEEVTDMQRSINGEVVYSTFDKTPDNHTKITELVLERAMRLVELKQDVVILLDSMTRLGRAYNLSINPTGRTLSGGLDPGALYGPKRFFGAARNIENGGSLTIIATSLIETGSRMDEVIFEEFKGTGNMEVLLDRKMSEKRIFPAIDINKSGTRREELLMTTKELDAVWTIRKAFGQLDTTAVTEAIINLLLKTTNNEHFISSVNVSFNDKNVFEAMRGIRPSDAAANNSGTGVRGGNGAGYGGYNSSGYNSNYRRPSSNDDD